MPSGLQYEGNHAGGILAHGFRSRSGLPVINVAGCPTHPDWVTETLLLAAGTLGPKDLDGRGPCRGGARSALAMDRFERGRIVGYQIVAPTTWNVSSRDASAVPGPLEAALEGAVVQDGETTPLAVQHIVRSIDPCMVCTVH